MADLIAASILPQSSVLPAPRAPTRRGARRTRRRGAELRCGLAREPATVVRDARFRPPAPSPRAAASTSSPTRGSKRCRRAELLLRRGRPTPGECRRSLPPSPRPLAPLPSHRFADTVGAYSVRTSTPPTKPATTLFSHAMKSASGRQAPRRTVASKRPRPRRTPPPAATTPRWRPRPGSPQQRNHREARAEDQPDHAVKDEGDLRKRQRTNVCDAHGGGSDCRLQDLRLTIAD